MAVHIFSGLGQWWHAEGTLFNSNRSCGAEQFDNNLPHQCFLHIGSYHGILRYISTAMTWRIWARMGATKCFRAVPQTYNGAMSMGYLWPYLFSWTNFRIQKSPPQVTMLHAGIFLEMRETAIPLLSMMTTATTVCLWCDARCALLPLCQSTGMSPSWMSAYIMACTDCTLLSSWSIETTQTVSWHPEHGQLRWMDTFQRSISWWMHRCFWRFRPNCLAISWPYLPPCKRRPKRPRRHLRVWLLSWLCERTSRWHKG